MTLTNNTTWVLDGLVKVGGDNTNQTVLTIEPGTLLTGNGATSDYLYVQPGSRIIADGKAYAPIIFTSPDDGVTSGREPAPKDWGGVVLSGNAPNNKCPTAPFDCRSEFDPNLRYGGNNPHDSSGILRYVQVRYSGYVFTEGREVNAFTMQSVGDGTVLDYLQAYRGGDDGIEFFGGTANLRHMVVTDGGDDSIDWDEGWSGKAQFAYSKTGTGFGEDNGFESSNQNENQDATPRAMPTDLQLHLHRWSDRRRRHPLEGRHRRPSGQWRRQGLQQGWQGLPVHHQCADLRRRRHADRVVGLHHDRSRVPQLRDSVQAGRRCAVDGRSVLHGAAGQLGRRRHAERISADGHIRRC